MWISKQRHGIFILSFQTYPELLCFPSIWITKSSTRYVHGNPALFKESL